MKGRCRNFLRVLLALAVIAAMIPAVLAAGETLRIEKNALHEGQTTTVRVTDSEGALVDGVEFTSSAPDVAEVSGTGVVTAKKAGSATITASKDGQPIGGAGVTVTVYPAVTIDEIDDVTINADTQAQAGVPVTVHNAIVGTDSLTAASDSAAVEAAIEGGSVKLTAKKLTKNTSGRAKITVSCADASQVFYVTVSADEQADHGVSFEAMTVKKDETKTNTPTLKTSTDRLTGFSSRDTSVASVQETTGAVTGRKVGSTTILATVVNKNGVEVGTASYTVTVVDDYKIDLSVPSGSQSVGDSAAIRATVSRFNSESGRWEEYKSGNVTISWSADAQSVAQFRKKTTMLLSGSGSTENTLLLYSAGTSKTSAAAALSVSAAIGEKTYTASASVTVVPAEVSAFAVNDAELFDEDEFYDAVNDATGANAKALDAITVDSAVGGDVYADSRRVSASAKYYLSGSTRRIGDLYFKLSSGSTTSAYFTYTGYDADGNVIASGKVTVGAQEVDIEYTASFGSFVTFDEDDFSRVFSKSVTRSQTLDYVTFDLPHAAVIMNKNTYNLNDKNNDSVFGWAYTTAAGTVRLDDTDRCYYRAGASQRDLDTVTYVTGSYRTRYTVYIPYTAVGVSGGRHEGYVAVTVTGDDTITASGASMKTLGAADTITAAFPNAAYVAFKQPATGEGRLLYQFRSIVAEDYTTISYNKDVFYLSGTGTKNLLLENVFFLPAADCASQIKLSYTAYASSGSSLGTGTLTVRVASKTASSVFPDVNAKNCAWAAAAVDFMNDYGLVKGTSATSFGWNGSMTRGDFVLILYRNAGSPSVSSVSNPFRDVSRSDYYYEAVLWAYQNGVVNGTGSTTFGPKGRITREQIASILWRLSGKPVVSASLRSYTDYASVSTYAYDAMAWAVDAGYVKGSGAKLNPGSNATRAEVVVMLHRYLTK